MSKRPVCSVSVDLDPLSCYSRIHGLNDARAAGEPDPVYTHALPRLLDLFEELGVRGTFFVIGEDLDHPKHVEILHRAVSLGHELASHTEHHPYDLPKQSPKDLDVELERVHARLSELTGTPPVGFRAPGYNIDARTLQRLELLGYEYDSSIFPCPPYYAAKAAVMGWLWLRKRPSGSSLIDPRTQFAPLRPYHPDLRAPHRKGTGIHRSNLVELPMCVLPGTRTPLIGTSLIIIGPRLTQHAIQLASLYHRKFINIELHGIDAIDPLQDNIPPELRARQPDLHHPIKRKLDTIRAAIQGLRGRYDLEPCREAARRFSKF